MRILFVCRSNVFRSQIAEGIFRKYCKGHEVKSAGTALKVERKGLKVKEFKWQGVELILKVMREEGIDISDCLMEQLTPDMVDWADKIVCMAERETIPDYLEGKGYEYWEVKDAAGNSDYDFFVMSRDKIKELVKNLVDEIC